MKTRHLLKGKIFINGLLVLTLLLAALPTAKVVADWTVTRETGIGTTSVGDGVAWTNPSFIEGADNGTEAFAASIPANDGMSEYLRATNFGFNIPAGANIDAIWVEIDRRSPGTAPRVRDESIQLVKYGVRTAANKAETGDNWPESSNDRTYTWLPTDPDWANWTADDINHPNFGVDLRVKNPNTTDARTAYVDYIWIQVEYTEDIWDPEIDSIDTTTPLSDPTNVSPIPITIEFNEPVFGFEANDVTVGNGTKSNFVTVAQDEYTLDITPITDGLVTAKIAANRVVDDAGNLNVESALFEIEYDGTHPEVESITTTEDDPTDASSIPLTITFSEPVTGFSKEDLLVINGKAGDVSPLVGPASVYTVNITPDGVGDGEPDEDGEITVDIAANKAFDVAGNGNLAAEQFLIYFDDTAPTVELETEEESPTNADTIEVTVTFSEPVTGLEESEIDVDNCAVVADSLSPETGYNAVYTFSVDPTAEGAFWVKIPAGAAQDLGEKDNSVSNQLDLVYDTTAPEIDRFELIDTLSDPTAYSPIRIKIIFDEDVEGLIIDNDNIENGVVSDFRTYSSNLKRYEVDITPAGDGDVILTIPDGACTDLAGNDNVGDEFSIEYAGLPTVWIDSEELPGPTNADPIPLTITFSEEVDGFEASEITVNANGEVDEDSFEESGRTYSVNINPLVDNGWIKVNVGNVVEGGNRSAEEFEIYYDGEAPTPTITSTAASDPTAISPIPITVDFGEVVTGFEEGDLAGNIGNGSLVADSLSTTDDKVYTFEITPTGDGDVTVDIDAGAAEDEAGNENIAATQFSIEYDGPPTVTIASELFPGPTNVKPIPLTITFSQDVYNFVVGSISVSDGFVSNFDDSAAPIYTVDLYPNPGIVDEELTVQIPAGAAQDAPSGGNDNAASSVFKIVYDITKPGVTLTSTAPNPTEDSPIPLTIEFDEPVVDFDESFLVLGNCTVDNFITITEDEKFTVDLFPTGDGLVTVDILANSIDDEAGNGNTAATQFTRTYEGPPTVAITSTATSPTTLSPIPVTITFSESVTNFASSEIITTNVSSITEVTFPTSGTTYEITVTPTGAGDVTVRVPAGVAASVADSELNLASADFVIEFTGVRPTVTITTEAGVATSTVPIPVTITFSEAVTGFDPDEIVVTNAEEITEFTSETTTVYQIEVTPLAVGDVTIEVPADVAVDADTLGNTVAVPLVIEYLGELPEVVSIERLDFDPTGEAEVDFLVTFSEEVFEVSNADFELTTTGSLTGVELVSTTGTGLTRTVTVSTGTGTGTLRLVVVEDAEIEDEDENLMEELPFIDGEVYHVRMATFTDVPVSNMYWNWIERLYSAGITAGCDTSPMRYCPDQAVTRAQMAIFIERGMNGSTYTPPSATGFVFTDVSRTSFAAAWIEKLYADGITAGCETSPLKYCPDSSINRAQMAIFLLRAKYGDDYTPPAVGFTTGFNDVPITHWAAPWIKQLAAEGITSGCGGGNYCPFQPVTRAQMAVFIVRTFELP